MQCSRILRQALLILLPLTVINVHTLVAQSGTSSAISGTVMDATGAVIANASIVATDVDTKAARTGKSNGEGRFLFSQVNPGNYTLTVSASGFAQQTSQPIAG